jgi:predicted hydrocarbon binding protein
MKTARFMKRYADGKLKIEDCLKIEKGKLLFMGGINCILLPIKDWGFIEKGIMEIHGPAVVSTMKMANKKAGYIDMNAMKKIFPKEKLFNLLKMYIEVGYVEKIIEIKIGNGDNLRETTIEKGFVDFNEKTDNKLIIKAKDSISSRSIKSVTKKVKYPVCFFEPSYLMGAFEAAFNKKCDVTETKCEGKGDSYCEWVFDFY